MITILLEKIKALLLELKTNIESISFENNYSLNESIVGSWIDGNTLYRKVFYSNDVPHFNSMADFITDMSIPDNANVVMMHSYANFKTISNVNFTCENGEYFQAFYISSAKKIQAYQKISSSDITESNVYIVLYYIKIDNEED